MVRSLQNWGERLLGLVAPKIKAQALCLGISGSCGWYCCNTRCTVVKYCCYDRCGELKCGACVHD